MKYIIFLVLIIIGGLFFVTGLYDIADAKTVMQQIVGLITWAIAAIFITGGLISLVIPTNTTE